MTELGQDISVFFTSDLISAEKRISPQWTIAYLKKRLEPITGIQPQFQVLQYYPSRTGNEYVELRNDDAEYATVKDYGIAAFSRVHVEDRDPESRLGELREESDVHFELTPEEYAQRSNTVLLWKKEQQLGRFNPEYSSEKARLQAQNAEQAAAIRVGQRCRVINIEGERRGVVKFVGAISELDGGDTRWVGVEFDEPVGKNDGLIGAVRVFQARPNHGSFVRPNKVEVGDFPELDPFDEDEI